MYWVKTPPFVQFILKRLIWRVGNTRCVHLTFDDGPVPEATPWVLDTLAAAGITATFFCVGENAEKYPAIYQRIIDEGHTVGNHTYNHLNSWKTDNQEYLDNVDKANKVINSKLFRPPYGKISPRLYNILSQNYDIIMWDVLSGDFDTSITAKQCVANVTSSASEGSIIVFHDSIKAIDKLKIVLPQVISFFQEKDVKMAKL